MTDERAAVPPACCGCAALEKRWLQFVEESDQRYVRLEERVNDRLLQIEEMLSPVKPLEAQFRARNMAQHGSEPAPLQRRCAFVAALIRTGFNPTTNTVRTAVTALAFEGCRGWGRGCSTQSFPNADIWPQVAAEFPAASAGRTYQTSTYTHKGRKAFQVDLSRFRLQLVTPFCEALLACDELQADASVDLLFENVTALVAGTSARRGSKYALHSIDQPREKVSSSRDHAAWLGQLWIQGPPRMKA